MRPHDEKLYRIIDANINRSKEGLRVCEDVCRFYLDDENLTKRYKNLRHTLTQTVSQINFNDLMDARAIEVDVGRSTSISEQNRETVTDIYKANSQRIKEALRVLEEFSKLMDPQISSAIKQLRYDSYALEQTGLHLLSAINR
ncbi:MAG: thiamine-phosphate pyrophosphorylase [Candidatus Omnitrophica bacterium]|nr:thiamine-phosphate pyrophosphorylase [Candidatus Omnitrophota bacterium]